MCRAFLGLSLAGAVFALAGNALATDPFAKYAARVKGEYEFHFTFPNGPTFTDGVRVDSLEVGEKSETTRTYVVKGAFLSPAAFGEAKFAKTSRLHLKATDDGVSGRLDGDFQAEGLDIRVQIEFAMSDVCRAVMVKSGRLKSRVWDVTATRVNQLTFATRGTVAGTLEKTATGFVLRDRKGIVALDASKLASANKWKGGQVVRLAGDLTTKNGARELLVQSVERID